MYKKIMIGLTTLVVLNGYVMMEVFDYYDSLYSNRIGSYENTIKKLEEVVDEFKLEGLDVTVTMYHPTTEQTDSTPDVLADGTRIRVHSASDYKFVAVSRNLLKKHGGWLDYGDFILLRGTDGKDGVYQVKDTMNRRFVNRIDILESPGTEPYRFDNAKILKTSIETDFTFINN